MPWMKDVISFYDEKPTQLAQKARYHDVANDPSAVP